MSKQPIVLSPMQTKATTAYVDLLRLENYSEKTINTYRNWFTLFLRCFPHHKPSDITKAEIMEMLLRYRNSKRWSAKGQNQFISAIKYFFEKVLKRKYEVYDLPRADRPFQLPTVFAQEEVKAIIMNTTNLKHKTILCMAYSGGLRVSELINMKIADIDSKRMVLTLRQAKGKKDRQVMLSSTLLTMLREYFKEYKPAVWLFEGKKQWTIHHQKHRRNNEKRQTKIRNNKERKHTWLTTFICYASAGRWHRPDDNKRITRAHQLKHHQQIYTCKPETNK